MGRGAPFHSKYICLFIFPSFYILLINLQSVDMSGLVHLSIILLGTHLPKKLVALLHTRGAMLYLIGTQWDCLTDNPNEIQQNSA